MNGNANDHSSKQSGGKRGNSSTPFEWEAKHHGHLDAKPLRLASERRQSISIARQRRYLAEPQPDPIEPYITGRYEDMDGKWTFHVNQAGTHIEVWMSEVVNAATRRPKQLLRLAGDRWKDDNYYLYLHDKPGEKAGTVRKRYVYGTKHLDIYLRGNGIEVSFDAVQNTNYPVLSESAMETIPSDQPVVKLHEWSPLVRSQVKWLRKMLAPIVLDPYIREFFSLPATGDTRSKVRRHEILMELDEYIGEVFSTTPPDGWHPDDMALVQFTARGLLAGTLCTFNSSRSHFDWIQTMVSISTGELDWKKHPSKLPSHLGMIPANAVLKAEQLHEYAVDFKIGGFAGELFASVGGWIGALTVEKKSPPTWKRMYDVVFAQIGAGFSIGVQIGQQNDGTARSSLAYTADDIPGSCTLMASGVHAGLISAGPGMLIINGRTLPPLAFNLTSLDSGNLELGGGVDVLTFMQGWIFRPFIKNHRSKPHPAKILRDEEFSATGHHADEIHFRLGDALLTEDARQLLRIVCARELKSFSDCGSILAIVGHADRVDTEERNIELSKLRAFNTLQAIKDILGNDLRIMPEKTSLSAMGEERAKEGGDVDGFPNPKWRKVEIIINHRLVLNLRGE